MASTSTLSSDRVGSGESSSLPDPTSHQLSKRQQYDALVDAEAGAEANVSLGSPASHPSYPAVASLCRTYPTQASAIFQTYLDLKNGAAAWDVVEPLSLRHPQQARESNTAVLGSAELEGLSESEACELVQNTLANWRSSDTRLGLVNPPEQGQGQDGDLMLALGLAAIKGRRKNATAYEIVIPLTISQHLTTSQLVGIFTLLTQHAASSTDTVDTSHVLLAIIAPDSTLVYYTVSQDMVKPVN
ncbi:alpha-tubulin folding cofactor B [Moesziomyces antarcticus T-34]|uniref:Alpha-tubulin folding cofactor B n=1 Tax=Pseudozyma antarctica (strain T-34) TaxID=1151754 RepID=M9MFW3_PSEA3|nr:alpha-tubulin folding cofactor B [Moesziomyces antarcticus T-34]